MSKTEEKQLLYFSFDIEADGPCPGINSMISLAFCGFVLENQNTTYKKVFQWQSNLKPMVGCTQNSDTMIWWNKPENKDAYEFAQQNQRDPLEAITELHQEILKLKETFKIIPGAWPSAYDWQWINYYFHKLIGSNPLGFSAKCISTLGWHIIKNPNPQTEFNWNLYKDGSKHTHKAIDDAHEQGVIWMNILIQMLAPKICSTKRESETIGTGIPEDHANFLKMCYSGDLDGVIKYIGTDKQKSCIKDLHGRNGIFYAIWNDQIKIIKYLMKTMPGIQNELTINNTSSYQIALSRTNTKIFRCLLTPVPKSHPNHEQINNHTLELLTNSKNILHCPEEMVDETNHPQIMKWINEFKSYVISNDSAKTFLDMCRAGDLKGVKKYVENDLLDPYVQDENTGNTGLIIAIHNKYLEIIKYLTNVAPGIHLIPNHTGTTSLQIAVATKSVDIVKLMLVPFSHFTNSSLINQKTVTLLTHTDNDLPAPIELAKSNGDNDIIKCIDDFISKNRMC